MAACGCLEVCEGGVSAEAGQLPVHDVSATVQLRPHKPFFVVPYCCRSGWARRFQLGVLLQQSCPFLLRLSGTLMIAALLPMQIMFRLAPAGGGRLGCRK